MCIVPVIHPSCGATACVSSGSPSGEKYLFSQASTKARSSVKLSSVILSYTYESSPVEILNIQSNDVYFFLKFYAYHETH